MTRLNIKKKKRKNTYLQREYLYYNFKSVRKSYFRVSKSYFLHYTCVLCIYTVMTWMCVFQMSFFIIYPKFVLISIICSEIFNVLQSSSCYYRPRSTLPREFNPGRFLNFKNPGFDITNPEIFGIF